MFRFGTVTSSQVGEGFPRAGRAGVEVGQVAGGGDLGGGIPRRMMRLFGGWRVGVCGVV